MRRRSASTTSHRDVDRRSGARSIAGAVAQAAATVGEQVADLERLGLHRQHALVRAGEDEQVLGELGEAVGLLDRRSDRGAKLLAARPVAQGQLQLALWRASGVRSS